MHPDALGSEQGEAAVFEIHQSFFFYHSFRNDILELNKNNEGHF